MKKRIFSIALMMLITLSIFAPISASAFTYGDKEYKEICIDENGVTKYLSSYNDDYDFYISNNKKTLYAFEKNTVTVTNNTVLGTSSIKMAADGHYIIWQYDTDNEVWNYQTTVTKNAGASVSFGYCMWNKTMTEVDNDDNSGVTPENPDQPEYDTPEVTYTIPAGLYIFNETPTMPTEDITQDFSTYFSVMVNNGLENVVYNGLRMKFTPTTIEYNLDGTLTTVYKGPPLADAGWSNVAYRQVTFIEDVTVSEAFYNLFILNTTPPPEIKPPYVFSNDGITYDGSTFATYKDENTKRVDVENTYCAMFDNGYVYIVSSTEPFRISSSGHVRPNPSISFDMWYIENGVINYMGTNTSFNPEKWVAGNHSILNWDNDAQYHGFDVGMVFPTTPQTQLPTVVGAEMMMGVLTEMIAMLPCLIALLMGYLALRKALAILRQILQTA